MFRVLEAIKSPKMTAPSRRGSPPLHVLSFEQHPERRRRVLRPRGVQVPTPRPTPRRSRSREGAASNKIPVKKVCVSLHLHHHFSSSTERNRRRPRSKLLILQEKVLYLVREDDLLLRVVDRLRVCTVVHRKKPLRETRPATTIVIRAVSLDIIDLLSARNRATGELATSRVGHPADRLLAPRTRQPPRPCAPGET
jgi:hypothetical protein